MSPHRLTRRNFCRLACLAPFAATAVLTGCGAIPSYRARIIGGRIVVPRSQIETSENKNEKKDNFVLLVRSFELAAPIILIVRKNGRHTALSSLCTHQACQVRPSGGLLSCPCHDSSFDLDGKVLRGPAPSDLRKFPVREIAEGFEILIREGG